MIEPDGPLPGEEVAADVEPATGAAGTTGRYVVTFADEADATEVLRSLAGVSNVCDSREFETQAVDMAETTGADAIMFSELGIALVSAEPERTAGLPPSTEQRPGIFSVSPELVHHIMGESSMDYVRGYRDGIADLSGRLDPGADLEADISPEPSTSRHVDDDRSTWGLQVTGVLSSSASGRGVRVAVLDTGIDREHPDFAGRDITARSFVDGEGPRDGHGHGTHCTGTACGPRNPDDGRRYGIAYDAEIFAGKVLSNEGWGTDAGILAGINWAVANECTVISMSLGADVRRPHPPYTQAGRQALRRGTLIVAAAGNNADRPRRPGFVGAPANSPTIMAVAALDSRLRMAPFSARTLPRRGGGIDVAGPGVDVYSSWRMPRRYRTISGTSMATPHAAGIAALWAEQTGRRGLELWATLAAESKRLPRQSADVGSGLVQAAL